jgi:general secretion pathway protein I
MRSMLTRSSALRQSKGFSLLEVMVALAILGMALVAIFQLFSMSLRTTKKAEDYTKAIFYARSMMDEAFIFVDPSGESKSEEYEDRYEVKREVSVKSESDDGSVKVYEIAVTVTWPPSGNFSMKELRSVYEPKE